MSSDNLKTPQYYIKLSTIILLINCVLVLINIFGNVLGDSLENFREFVVRGEKPSWTDSMKNKMGELKQSVDNIQENIQNISKNLVDNNEINNKFSRNIAPTIKLITTRLDSVKRNMRQINEKIRKLKIKLVSLQEHPSIKNK